MSHVLRNVIPEDDIACDPEKIDLLLASQASKEGRVDDAMKIANGILNKNPHSAPALFFAAWAFIKMERYGIAHALLKRSVEIKPRPETWNNLAMACIGMQRLDEARAYLEKALRTDKSNEAALNNMALISVYECMPAKAIEYAVASIKQNQDQWNVKETLGYAHLMLGDWKEGWLGYEAMLGKNKQRPLKPPHEGVPYWDGSEGLDLYLRGEQGMGDEISFASMLPEIAAKQKHVTFDCHPKLAGLFKRSFPQVEVRGTRQYGEVKPSRDWLDGRDFDQWALIGSAAQYLRNETSQFPGTPYLVADQDRRLQWRALLDTLPGKKIGIAWTGGYPGTFRERRSLSLDTLLPVLKTKGITWVSLQYEDSQDEVDHFLQKTGINIRHWPRATQSEDYDDNAALVSELDLVISVCTSVVHLCGALGKECWCISPEKPRWFYLTKGQRIPWYDSVEMFRQVRDTWPFDEVIERLTSTLDKRGA